MGYDDDEARTSETSVGNYFTRQYIHLIGGRPLSLLPLGW
jgi:hypothetical protein